MPTDYTVLGDFYENQYISKSGDDYISALSSLFNLKNKNDKPFTVNDIIKEPTMKEFKNKFVGVNEFKYICDLYASPMTIENEKIIYEKIKFDNLSAENEKIFKKSNGIVYILTCEIDGNEHIIKIGQSRKSFNKRLSSYNCGNVGNWRTASTTNIKMLQSFVTTRKIFKLYIYDCSEEVYNINWYGVQSINFPSSKSLAIEDIMIKKYIEIFNKKPLANIQADASN